MAEAVVKAVSNYKGIKYTAKNTGTTVNSDYYTVKKGDTLWDLAVANNTTVKAIKDLNNLTSDTLKIGQQLKLPNKSTKTTSTENIYTVKKGDTLWDIAKLYNTTVSELKSINNLSTNVLQIGQKLKIPSSTYTVKKGDSLWKIAKEYNTSINDLIKINNLKSTTLQIGQKLILP